MLARRPRPIIRCVLVCIAKAERLYIEEFINYYLKLGFYKIIIYDNSDSNELNFLNSPSVQIINFPGNIKQLAAYEHFLKYLKHQYHYVAFFDVDEFLVLKRHNNINDFCLQHIPSGALGVNWYIFGNNGQTKYEPRGVLERFTRRSSIMDHHVKTIAKCSDILKMKIHEPETLKKGTYFKNISGHKLELGCAFNFKKDDTIVQLNHYFTKSDEELQIKCDRGRADLAENRKYEENKIFLEFNDVEDTLARDFMRRNLTSELLIKEI
jgi:hypothetical protein